MNYQYTKIEQCKDVEINNTAPVYNQIFHIGNVQNLQVGNNNSMYSHHDDSSSDESISNDDQDDQLFTCDLPLDDGRLTEISQKFSNHWKFLGEALNLSEEQLNGIRTYSCSIEQKSYLILQTWMKKYENPTICDLAQSFDEDEENTDKFKKVLYDAVLKPKRQPAIEGSLSGPKFAIEAPNSSLVPK